MTAKGKKAKRGRYFALESDATIRQIRDAIQAVLRPGRRCSGLDNKPSRWVGQRLSEWRAHHTGSHDRT
jgi:hypothetical protein